MTSNHTPGPWKALEYNELSGFVLVSDNAEIAHIHESNHSNPDTGKANARLIATAPDLLEALEQLLADHPVLRTHPIGAPNSRARHAHEGAIRAYDNARAAIAKARGE